MLVSYLLKRHTKHISDVVWGCNDTHTLASTHNRIRLDEGLDSRLLSTNKEPTAAPLHANCHTNNHSQLAHATSHSTTHYLPIPAQKHEWRTTTSHCLRASARRPLKSASSLAGTVNVNPCASAAAIHSPDPAMPSAQHSAPFACPSPFPSAPPPLASMQPTRPTRAHTL